jgi:hypothetical protein
MRNRVKHLLSRLRASFHRRPAAPRPELSILIASIPSRLERFLVPLLRELDAQIGDSREVEVLTLVDNRSMTIGEKRNRLRSIAAGRYSAYVDDDDRVGGDYVASILEAIRTQPGRDVYCFDVWVRGYEFVGIGGADGILCRYGVALPHRNGEDRLTRKPNHLMVFRTSLAQEVPFPHTSWGEDDAWADRIAGRVRSEGRIDGVLYHYDYSVETSESPWSATMRARIAEREAMRRGET